MLVLALLCVYLCFPISFATALDDSTPIRLPNNIIPLRYNIDLKSDIHRLNVNFSGTVKIVFQVFNYTNQVVIHQQGLNISANTVKISLLNKNFEWIKYIEDIKNISYVSSTNFLTIETNLNTVLMKDEIYSIEMGYDGVLNSNPNGFYSVLHSNNENETILSAMTQLKPIHARQMFPCLDEPQLKAVFSLQITHGRNVTAISNMPGNTVTTPGDLVVTKFLDTPPMSTYSVSLILSNLTQIIYAEDSNKIVHQVYSTFEETDQLDLLSQTSQKVLPTFISTLGVKYSLPQLTHIVLVNSNINTSSTWGVITYHDSPIYFHSTDYFYQQQEHFIKLITHEIAQQFFGNAFSPEWWNSSWLVEGLTTVISNIVLNIEYPNYRTVDDFLVNIKLDVMVLDQNGDIPTFEYDIVSFDQTTDVMAAKTKSKAACIIYMMMHAIHEEVFIEGLKEYLIQQENSTISSFEFFERLDTIARYYDTLSINTTMTDIINRWSSRKGVPLLTVHRNYTSGLITVTQANLESTESILELWTIPYNFIVKREAKLDAWLTNPHGWFDQRINTTFIQPYDYRNWSSTDWVLFNKKSTGYYRVNYDRANWDLLILDLHNYETFPLVHYLNRAQLIDDSFILAKENILSYEIPLYLAQFLQHETEHFVWQSFYKAYQYLERILFQTQLYDEFSTYIKSLADIIYTNFDRKNYHDVLTQKIVITILCRARHYNCIQETQNRAVEFIYNGAMLPQYLEEEYLHNGIRFVDVTSIKKLFTLAMTSTEVTKRSLILGGLGYTSSSECIEILMKATITVNTQTVDDITINLTSGERKVIILSIINNSPNGFLYALDFLIIEQEQCKRIFINEIPNILESISYRIGTSDSFARFRNVIDSYKNIQNQVTLNKYLENAKQNIDWLDNRLDDLKENLQNINHISNTITLFVPFSLIVISQVLLIFKISVCNK